MEEDDGQAAAHAYADAWGLSAVRPMGRTFSSFLFRTEQGGRALVLKVFTPAGRPEEAVGAAALAWFAGDGAAEVYRCDDAAVAMEFLPGEDLLALVRAGRDDDASRVLGDVGRRLHARPQREVPSGLMPLETRIRALEGRAGGDAPVLARRAAVARDLLADGGERCVLHRDLHHENVRRRASGAWVALAPKGLVGERAYDGANVLCNSHALPRLVPAPGRLEHKAAVVAAAMTVDPERLLAWAFVHACLSACWSLEDGQDPRHALSVAARA